MLFIHFKVWKHHKTMKTYQETYGNFLGIFARKLTCVEVQIAKTGVHTVTESRKRVKKLRPAGKEPKTHGSDGPGSS